MVQSAGLSRAYAVLRQLELLRQQDIIDPLPPAETETDASSTPMSRMRSLPRDDIVDENIHHNYQHSHHYQDNSNNNNDNDNSNSDNNNSPRRHKPEVTSQHSAETRLVQSCSYDTTPSLMASRRLSPHPRMEGRHQTLQRVLQDIVEMRKKAGKNRGEKTDDSSIHSSSCSSRKRTSLRLLSPSKDIDVGGDDGGGEENVFFDEQSLSFSALLHGAQKKKASMKKNTIITKQQAPEEEEEDRIPYRHELSHTKGEHNKNTSRVTSHAHNGLHEKTKTSHIFSAASDYTNSLLLHHRGRQGKLQCDEIQGGKKRKEHEPFGRSVSSQKQMNVMPLSSALSPITRLDEDGCNDDFSLLHSRELDFCPLQREAAAEKPSLMSFIRELTIMGSAELQNKLRGVGENECDGTVGECRNWFALTALVNGPDAIRHVILPLFLSELLEQKELNCEDRSDAHSRISHILCALIGFGDLAAAALPILLHMLTCSLGCPRLVALAVRAVGGDEGIHALCSVAQSEELNPGVRAAAVYGLSTLAYRVLGHTTIYCMTAPGLSGKIVFYQPPVLTGYFEVEKNGERRREQSLQRPPPYRPTHVILSAEMVRNKLLHFTTSRNFRRATSSYESLPAVLWDFACDAPETCRQQGLGDDVQEALKKCTRELEDASSHSWVRVLSFSYDPHYIGREEELFAIEEILMNILHDRRTPLSVVEQTLVSVASLPDFATRHVASPVLDYVIQHAAHFEKLYNDGGSDGAINGKETVLIAGLVALGRLVRNEGTSPSVTDTACTVLLHCLLSPSCRVRHAACIGLGEVGAVSNNSGSITMALTDCLSDAGMNRETVAWSLTRFGMRGVGILLDHISVPPGGSNNTGRQSHDAGVSLVPSTRIVCARALSKIDFLSVSLGIQEDASRLREDLVRQLAGIISTSSSDNNNNMEEEEVVLECVYALAEALSFNGKIQTQHRNEEAAHYYRSETPNEAFKVLKSVVESASFSLPVLRALFYTLCMYGGAHGELYVSQTVIQGSIVVLRAAAAFGLRACGGKIIRTLVMALNDDDASVRLEAFDTLDALGVEPVLAILRTRPYKHTQQVVAALRDCLLRDMGRDAKRQVAQELYAFLLQT